MVLSCMHPAAKIPHITTANDITGTSRGVYLSAYSSNNATYNQDYTTIHRYIWVHTAITTHHINKPITSQEHMVFICLHPAATTPHITKDKKNITGTSGNGVSLYAYSDNNATYNHKTIQQYHRNIRWCLSGCIQR